MMAHHPAIFGFLIGLILGGPVGFMLAACFCLDDGLDK